MGLKKTLAALLILALPAITPAAPPPDTAEGILGFADELTRTGESYRAVTEYLRALHHFGTESETKNRALLGLADAYAKAGRYSDAADRLLDIDSGRMTPDLKLALGEAFLLAGRYREAAQEMLKPGAPPGAEKLGTLAWLKTASEEAPPPGADKDLIARYKAIPRKSPQTAGLLSAILPGAGHLYVDRPHDAAMAFILNGAFIYGTIEAARRDQWGLAGVLGAAELLWYSGTIIGSANGAHKWNMREEENFYRQNMKIPGLRWSGFIAPGMGGVEVSMAW